MCPQALAIREGQGLASVAAAHGVNRWLADFANGGQNALLAKPIPGRPSMSSPSRPFHSI